MVAKKKMGPTRRVVKPRGTPVPLPQRTPKRVPGLPLPAPMPTMEGNYGKPRIKARPRPIGPKKPASPKLEILPQLKRQGRSKIKAALVRRKMI